MDVFEYLEEEVRRVTESLKELIAKYETWSREHVFDRVKEVNDRILAHVSKQESLLLKNLPINDETAPLIEESNKDRAALVQELELLVMVHVDEPEYDECLTDLLRQLEKHNSYSHGLYSDIKTVIPEKKLKEINELVKEEQFRIVDFNQLHPQDRAV